MFLTRSLFVNYHLSEANSLQQDDTNLKVTNDAATATEKTKAKVGLFHFLESNRGSFIELFVYGVREENIHVAFNKVIYYF